MACGGGTRNEAITGSDEFEVHGEVHGDIFEAEEGREEEGGRWRLRRAKDEHVEEVLKQLCV